MEIIELDSSCSTLTPKSPDPQTSWNYNVRKKHDVKGNLNVTKTLNDRPECSFTKEFGINDYNKQNRNKCDERTKNISPLKERVAFNREINCFTIVNRHFDYSDTSSEYEDRDIELFAASGDINRETVNWNQDHYQKTMNAFNTKDHEKTIWIYSYKNKNLLSDYEPINYSNETSSSSSRDFNVNDLTKSSSSTETSRLPSPIPTTYVPRLNLTLGQTLSTLTEVTEPVRPEMLNVCNSLQKQFNSWFPDQDTGDSDDSNEKSRKLITQMGLSPRFNKRSRRRCAEFVGDIELRSHPKKQDKQTSTTANPSLEVQKRLDEKLHFKSIFTSSTASRDDKLAKIHEEIEPFNESTTSHEDFGTNEARIERKRLRKPHITMERTFTKDKITDPIEKLECNNWIIEENDNNNSAITDFVLSNMEEDNLNCGVNIDSKVTKQDMLWTRNAAALLRPAQWGEYLAITETPLTPQLSLSNVETKSCFTRFINWFKCWK